MSTATGTRTRRQVLIDGMGAAADAERPDTDGCRDCPESETGTCGDHRADEERSREYADAEEWLRTASSEEIAAELGGEGGERS